MCIVCELTAGRRAARWLASWLPVFGNSSLLAVALDEASRSGLRFSSSSSLPGGKGFA